MHRASTAGEAGPESFREPAQIETLQLLYRQSAHGAVSAAVTALLWGRIVWEHADRARLLAWCIAVTLMSSVRLALFVAYFLRRPQGRALLAWELPYKVSLLLAALVWGVGCMLVVPGDSLLLQAITLFFLIGMTGAALPAYGVLLRTTQALAVTMLAPMTLFLFWQGEPTGMLLAAATAWFFVTVVRATYVNSTAVNRSILLTHELRAARSAAERQAQTDPLTALNNRRAFTRAAEALVALGQRERRPSALLLLDVDHFKKINDTHGHAAGDGVLLAVADLLLANTRRSDVCGRIGGDEFAVLLPNTGIDDATRVADALRTALADHPTYGTRGPVHVTLSIGVSPAEAALEVVLGLADKAMYEAKRSGRDRVARLA